ncbi:MAG: AAA family ATPase [Polyangiaceae bacterium]|nr:AAA family ATPase [Polyangiaceae bacterium]
MNRILRHIELVRDKVPNWEAYPFAIPAVAKLDRLEFDPRVTFFVGDNGSGKSTLVEAIAIKAGFNPEGGTKNFQTRLRPSESSLHEYLRLARGARREHGGFFLRAETMFNVSTEAEAYGAYGWKDLHEKSHGEAFLWVAIHRFRDRGLFILDEPEAALSPQRQLALMGRMRQLIRAGSQFIVSTHSPILMAYPGARIYLLDRGGIERVSYTDTEHYAVTKTFLQDPERMLQRVFADVDAAESE